MMRSTKNFRCPTCRQLTDLSIPRGCESKCHARKPEANVEERAAAHHVNNATQTRCLDGRFAENKNTSSVALFCHCIRASHSVARNKLSKSSVNSSTSLFQKLPVFSYAPYFFKIALLVVVLNNITVSASPMLKRIAANELRLSEYLQASTSRETDLALRLSNLAGLPQKLPSDESAPRTSVIVKTILSRMARSSSCLPSTLERLAGLIHHTSKMAHKAEQRHSRRSTARRTRTDRPWALLCHQVYNKLKVMNCDLNRHNGLFGNKGNDIKTSIKSMIIMLQQEMIDLNQGFVGILECDATSEGNGFTETERKLSADLFAMNTEVNQIRDSWSC